MIRFYAVLMLSFFWVIPTQTSGQDTLLEKEVSATI